MIQALIQEPREEHTYAPITSTQCLCFAELLFTIDTEDDTELVCVTYAIGVCVETNFYCLWCQQSEWNGSVFSSYDVLSTAPIALGIHFDDFAISQLTK